MDKDYKRAANITIISAGLLLLFWLFIRYALAAVMPFLLGAAVAAIVSPLSKKISFHTKISLRFISGSLVLILFAGISTTLYFTGARLVRETGNLVDRITQDPNFPDNIIGRLTGSAGELDPSFREAGERLFESVGINIDTLIENAINSIVSSISSAIPSYAVKIVAGVPSFIFFTVVFLISAFYFATDKDNIGKGLKSFLPDSWQKKLPSLSSRIKKTISGYLKAYFFIMLLTFIEIFIGLSLLRVNYALLVALLVQRPRFLCQWELFGKRVAEASGVFIKKAIAFAFFSQLVKTFCVGCEQRRVAFLQACAHCAEKGVVVEMYLAIIARAMLEIRRFDGNVFSENIVRQIEILHIVEAFARDFKKFALHFVLGKISCDSRGVHESG